VLEARVEGKHVRVEDLLQRDVFDVDEEPHIIVPKNPEAQKDLPRRALVLLCPAACYTEAGGRIVFSYEGCLECGLCRVLGWGRISWGYPRSGRGVQYRFT
jgi:ferredoxin like protein